ncbi:MAG: branched-chain amino acid ABC transporter permease [Myxococcales bacterium]
MPRLRARWAAPGALFVLLLLAPRFLEGYALSVLILCCLWAALAMSWDFMSGQTGRENFGHGMFIGTGAYTAAFLNLNAGVAPWPCVLAGAACAVVVALVIGVPTLRLQGPYFALATLAAAAILQRLTIIFWEQTGGEEGLSGLTPIAASPAAFYAIALAFLVLTAAVLVGLAASPWGILLRAIRGDELACEASGISTTRHKIAALLVSAFFAGAGGALYAFFQLQAGPYLFGVPTSLSVIIMSYVGGIGSVYGAIGGAFVITALSEGLRRFGEYRLLFHSLVLILILFFLPGGLIAPLWRRLKGAGAAP